jgi:hypothetical protein
MVPGRYGNGFQEGGRQLKKAIVILMLLGLVAGLLAITVTGCGDDKSTVKTPYGDVTVEEDGGQVTYQTEEGDVSYDVSDKPPTEAELGAPIYPDAEYVPGSGGTVSATGAEGEFTTAGAEFTTSDSIADVLDFYIGELGEPSFQDPTTGEASWMLDMGEESFTVVTITDEGGEVSITIGRMAGAMGQ